MTEAVVWLIAGLVLLAYFVLLPEPLWAAIGWNVLFSVINAYQVYLLWLERRPVLFSGEEQHLYQLAFRTLTPREFKKLVAIGTWQDADVVVVEPTRFVSWPRAELRRFLERNPDLRSALQMVIGTDLASKLRSA